MLRIECVFAIHSWKKNNDFANVILTKLVRKGYWKLSILGCHFIKNHWRLIIDPRRRGGYPLPLNPTPFVPPLSLQPVSAPDYRIFNVASIDNAPCIESIQVDSTLHVKLHHNGCQIPLPKWFKQNQYLLKNISILENLASCMRIFVAEKKKKLFKMKFIVSNIINRKAGNHIHLKFFVFHYYNAVLQSKHTFNYKKKYLYRHCQF